MVDQQGALFSNHRQHRTVSFKHWFNIHNKNTTLAVSESNVFCFLRLSCVDVDTPTDHTAHTNVTCAHGCTRTTQLANRNTGGMRRKTCQVSYLVVNSVAFKFNAADLNTVCYSVKLQGGQRNQRLGLDTVKTERKESYCEAIREEHRAAVMFRAQLRTWPLRVRAAGEEAAPERSEVRERHKKSKGSFQL